MEDFIRETARKAKECGINNFLFDLRRARNRTTPTNHYEFVYRRSRQLGFRHSSKHALGVSPEGMVDYSFVKTVLNGDGGWGRPLPICVCSTAIPPNTACCGPFLLVSQGEFLYSQLLKKRLLINDDPEGRPCQRYLPPALKL
jgi:hypothetical protein